MLLLALALPALAHTPHVAVPAVAIPRGTTSEPWWVAVGDAGTQTLFRSDDDGLTFAPTWSLAMADPILDGAYTDDGHAVFLGTNRIIYGDATGLWTSQSLAVTLAGSSSPMAGGDRLYFASPRGGVYSAAVGGTPAVESGTSSVGMSAMFEGAGGPVAITTAGGVYWKHGLTWSTLALPSGVLAASGTYDGTYVYAGSTTGTVYRTTGTTWTSCGTVPYASEASAHPSITRMAGDGSTLIATRAGMGPAISTDDCASWTSAGGPFAPEFLEDGTESFTTDALAFSGVGIYDSRVWTAGYDGFGTTDDSGASWSLPSFLGGDDVTGVAFSARFNTDGDAMVSTTGGGVIRTLDGGTSFSAPNLGGTGGEADDIAFPLSATSANAAYAIMGNLLYRTTNRGSTWSYVDGPFTALRQLDLGVSNHIFANDIDIEPSTHGAAQYSTDNGVSWRSYSGMSISFDQYPIQHVYDRTGLTCVHTIAAVACSEDERNTWTDAYIPTSGEVYAVTGVPDSAPTKVLVGDSSGIWSADVGTWTFTQVYTSDQGAVRHFVTADNGTIFGATQGGSLVRSTDAGATWTATGAHIPTQITALATRPNFARWGELLVGGPTGAWIVDSAFNVRRFMAWQRVDDATAFETCDGCTQTVDSSAGMGTATEIGSGDTYTVTMRGSRFRVMGKVGGRTSVEVFVDGVSTWSGTVSRTTYGQLLLIRGLSDDWHTFEIQTTGTVSIDATESGGSADPADGWGTSTAILLPDDTSGDDPADGFDAVDGSQPDAGPGGCTTTPAAGGLLLALGGLASALARRAPRQRAR